jgi:polysaccharide biosynthesis/export protein
VKGYNPGTWESGSYAQFWECVHEASEMMRNVVMVDLFVALLGCTWLSAQQPSAQTPSKQPENTAGVAQYILGPGDQVKIWALGAEEVGDKPFRVDPSGNLDVPLIGTVHAGGLTVDRFKAELVQRFSGQLLQPQVSVEIVDYGSQPVSVMGAFNHPGVHQLQGRKTLAEVVSLADGLRQDAGPRLTISRKIEYGPIPLLTAKPDPTGKFSVADVSIKDVLDGAHPAENILISPYDVITVPPAEAVFVIGEVQKPGEIALKDNISVLRALSSAGGFGPTPAPQNSKIVRLVPGTSERNEIPVDLRKILAGQAEDVAMRPNDILVVPPNGPKKAVARVMEAAIQTATGVIIWRRP